MSECVRFCPGCPRVPKGVIAEVESVEFMNRRRLTLSDAAREFIMAHNGLDHTDQGFGDVETLIARVETVAVEVNPDANPTIEAGDGGELYLLAGSTTAAEIEQQIGDCTEPIVVKRRWGHDTIVCNAIDDKHVLDPRMIG